MRARRFAAVALSIAAMACAHGSTYHGLTPASAQQAQTREPMNSPSAGDTTTIRDGDLVLQVELVATAADAVRVRYRLENRGAAPLAVFDRGDRHAVLMKRQAAGATGAPTFEDTGDGDVVLRHVALPPARGFPTGPTVPPTPLALKLAPGASLDGGFAFSIPTASPPRRVRWCLGVVPFGDGDFFSPEQAVAGEVWQAGDDAVQAQRTLCTPWFDVAAGAFAGNRTS